MSTQRDHDERVSLAPLDPETALRALLKVKPLDPPGESDVEDPSPADGS